MYISSACDAVIEITRRCNMCCAHCLRGDAIAQYIENHFDECVEAAKGAIHISEV